MKRMDDRLICQTSREWDWKKINGNRKLRWSAGLHYRDNKLINKFGGLKTR